MVRRILQDELRLPERVVEPGPAQLMEVHAEAQLVDADFLEHGRGRHFKALSAKNEWT